MKPIKKLIITIIFVVLVSTDCQAKVIEKDVLVIGRIIGLLDKGPKGETAIAVVTNGEATRADADSIIKIIGAGKTIGAVILMAEPVDYEQLTATAAKILYLPSGLSNDQLNTIFKIASERKLVTISTSDNCLRIQKCAVAISSEPAVDIRLSLAASAATNVAFSSTFRMIIKEVQ